MSDFSAEDKRHPIRWITQSAVIAAFYVVLTFLTSLTGLSNGPIQLRLSEALTILPVLTTAAIPGLSLGCLIANILTGCALWDIILGSLATLIGAVGTYLLRSVGILKYAPPVLANTLILPFVFSFVYAFEGSWMYFAMTIFISELLSCGILGALLLRLLDRYRDRLF